MDLLASSYKEDWSIKSDTNKWDQLLLKTNIRQLISSLLSRNSRKNILMLFFCGFSFYASNSTSLLCLINQKSSLNPLIFDLLSYSNSGVVGPYSSSPLCVEDVRLCLEAKQQLLQEKKSSSLSNINQRGKAAAAAASRRRSLPGTPTRGRNGGSVNSLTTVWFTFLPRGIWGYCLA